MSDNGAVTEDAAKGVLSRLERLYEGSLREESISRTGTKINVPAGTSYLEAAQFLVEAHKAEEAETVFQKAFRFRPWDGAFVTHQVMREVFGGITAKASMGFFGPEPPRMIEIPVGPNETAQVPWGEFVLPHLPGAKLHFSGEEDEEIGLVFKLVVTAPKRYAQAIENLFRLIEEELPKRSIYKGKAIDAQGRPDFLDLSAVDPEKVVYSAEVFSQLEASVFAPIRWPEAMRSLDVPLKRAVLLHGTFGTGKTLAGYLTGKEAVANGWTFLYVRPGRDDLHSAMQTAKLYAPAVVFFEDVETIGDADGETERVSSLLDLFDGIQAKGAEVMAVLTSNHADRLHKGLVRPGRLDAIIEIGTPDAAGIRKLIEVSIGGRLDVPESDWSLITDAMQGFLPAFVKEAADRAIRYALTRQKGETAGLSIGTPDLLNAVGGLGPHVALMAEASEGVYVEPLGEAVGRVVTERVSEALAARFG